MKRSNQFNMGILLIFLYCIFLSLSQVITGHYEQIITPSLLATYIFLLTILFYTITTVQNLSHTWQLVKAHLSLVIKINISTALAWTTVILALKNLEPSSTMAICFGILPVSTMVVSFLFKDVVNPKKIDILFSVILLVLISILCIYLIDQDLATKTVPMSALIISLSLCIISGISNAFNTIYAKILSQKDFSPSQVISVRFYISLLSTLTLVFIEGTDLIPSWDSAIPIVWITLLSTIIPMYLLQKGISYSNAITVALITPILPAITFILEQFDKRIIFSGQQLIIVTLISITIFAAAFYQVKKKGYSR